MYSSFSEDILSCGNQQKLQDAKTKFILSGRELMDLSMINPDIPPARILIDKLVEASVKSGSHRYSVSKGIKKLRTAFSEKYSNVFSVKINPETQVCITMGTKDALVNSLAVLSSYSKSVLLPSPTYPAYQSAAEISGLKAIYYNICQSEDLILSEIAEKLKVSQCKIIVLNFPNNPTGKVVSQDFYIGLKKILSESSVIVFNDFVYGEMGFDHKAQPSLLSIFQDYEYLLESYSLSKAYSIPGWRIAALIGNQKIVERLVRLKSHIDYGIFLPLQFAASSALQNSTIVTDNSTKYFKRFKLLSANLSKLKWEVEDSKAGAALWAKIPATVSSLFRNSASGVSMALCLDLLEKSGVLFTPGIVFGKPYDEFIRVALVNTEEKLFEISKILAQYQNELSLSLEKQNAA